jgi:ribosome-associated protein
MIKVTRNTYIRKEELVFRASRSAGPGGQNVNKVNTRITLLFDVTGSRSLSDRQKKLILSRLSTRIDKNGLLQVVSQKFRTQKANRNAAVDKFQKLLADALKSRPIRKKTRIPFAAKQKRLEEKRKRSQLKKLRSQKHLDE